MAILSSQTSSEAFNEKLCIDVQEVARMCSCSTRHIWRLADAGKMPAPIRLGALVRWNRQVIEQWIAAGCPPARRTPR
jgi:excisionase family DNA binding protein